MTLNITKLITTKLRHMGLMDSALNVGMLGITFLVNMLRVVAQFGGLETLTTLCQPCKTSSLRLCQNKLECLSLTSFTVDTILLSRLGFRPYSQTRLKSVARDKHTSLFKCFAPFLPANIRIGLQ